jgi:hypothetical protein
MHVAAGAVYGLSVLLYVSNVIPVAVVGVAGLVASLRTHVAWIVPVVSVSTAALGAGIAHAISGSPLPIQQWLVSYAGGTANMSFGGNALLSLFRVVFGLGSSLVASRGAARLVRRWSEGADSVDPLPGDAIELAIWGAALVVAFGLTVLALGSLRRTRGLERAALLTGAASCVALFAFNYRWIGSDPQFWVPVVPLLWIVWGFAFARIPRAAAVGGIALLVLLLPYNVFRELRPLRGDTRPKAQRVELMNHTADGSLIITPGLDWVATLCRYYTMGDRDVLSLWGLSVEPEYTGNWSNYLDAVGRRVDEAFAAGSPVYVRGVVEEAHPDGVPWRDMAPRGFPLAGLQTWLARYEARRAFTVGGDVYWELSPSTQVHTPYEASPASPESL